MWDKWVSYVVIINITFERENSTLHPPLRWKTDLLISLLIKPWHKRFIQSEHNRSVSNITEFRLSHESWGHILIAYLVETWSSRCMVRFFRMRIFIQMMHHPPKKSCVKGYTVTNLKNFDVSMLFLISKAFKLNNNVFFFL